jgi:hypothetical protein
MFYVMMRGALRYYSEYNSYPGASDPEQDITEFKVQVYFYPSSTLYFLSQEIICKTLMLILCYFVHRLVLQNFSVNGTAM